MQPNLLMIRFKVIEKNALRCSSALKGVLFNSKGSFKGRL
ncbi:MAG: hypothetical protein PG977_001289 [Bartonella clarridgeiae]|nr:MAG: hypothetical protein PG977_001289 [Bartonella clarridgeiae]